MDGMTIDKGIEIYGPEDDHDVLTIFYDRPKDKIYVNARTVSPDALLQYLESNPEPQPRAITDGKELFYTTDVLMMADPMRAAGIFEAEQHIREKVLNQNVK